MFSRPALLLLGGIALLGLLVLARCRPVPRLLANNARYHITRGNPREALRRIDQAWRAGLDQAETDVLRLRALFLSERFDECLRTAEGLGQGPWGEPEDWRRAATAALELDRVGRALPWLTRYAEDPRAEPGPRQFALGTLALAQGRTSEAVDHLSRAQSEDPREAFHAALCLGRALRAVGQPLQANAALLQAKALRPDDLRTLAEMARGYRDLGETETFRYLLDEIRRLEGDADSIAGEDGAAKAWIDSAVAGGPVGAPAPGVALLLSEMALPRGREAIARLRGGLWLHGAWEELTALGRRLEEDGRRQEALAAYEAALEIVPQSLATRFHARRLEPGRPVPPFPTQVEFLNELACQTPGAVSWAGPEDLAYTEGPGGATFRGQLASRGGVAGSLARPDRTAGCWACLSATRIDGVGAWAEARVGEATRRVYVDSPVPRFVRLEFLSSGQSESAVAEIRFLNDAKVVEDGRTVADRNLMVLGLGFLPESSHRPAATPPLRGLLGRYAEFLGYRRKQ
jgi:tetratricopeptide (TPR) repeat protein